MELKNYQTIEYNNGIGSRDRHSTLLFYIPEKDTIIEFKGSHIPGVAVILNSSYKKAGKWSSTTYQIAYPANIKAAIITQDWDNRKFIPENNWEDAFKNFKERTGFEELSFEEFKSFVKYRFSKSYQRLEETKSYLKELGIYDEVIAFEKKRREIETQLKKEIEILEQKKKIQEESQLLEWIEKAMRVAKSGDDFREIQEIYNGFYLNNDEKIERLNKFIEERS